LGLRQTITIIVGIMPRKVVVDIETIPCPDGLRDLIPRKRSQSESGFWRRLFAPLAQSPENGEDAYLHTALNPAFGRIVCIGLLLEQDGRPTETRAFLAQIKRSDTVAESQARESEALRAFWEAILPDDYFIGHNILNFDLPFLWNRSLVCGVRPSRSLHLERETTQFTFDTMQAWGHWSARQYTGLNVLGQVMGLGGKTGSGSQVYRLWHEQRFDEIRDYCLGDVKLEYALYRRMTLDGMAPALEWNSCSRV
jgi:3'-5' exonuclease